MARKLFLEGGWTQKRLCDIDWSDTSQSQACKKEEGTEKHRLYHCPEWPEDRQEIPEEFRKLEQKTRTSRKEWKWRRGIVEHPPSGRHWNRAIWSLRSIRAGAPQQKASSATLPRTAPCWETAGKWRACGGAVVQLDYDGAIALSRGRS